MQNEKDDLKSLIKDEAAALGFDFCAIARAGKGEEQGTLARKSWLDKGVA